MIDKQNATKSITNNSPPCPLCHEPDTEEYHQDKRRRYYQCSNCTLVFVSEKAHLSSFDEKREYDLHQNSPEDAGYRSFLNRLVEPMLARLSPDSHGLDFGSGPGPALPLMFQEHGHRMEIFDQFYAPNPDLLNMSYDFITATEVVEHLRQPAEELERLWRCLNPGGYLGIMTKMVIDAEAFSRWHYKNDPTHICFFSRSTFEFLAKRWGAEVEFIGKDVVVFRKSGE